MFSDSHACSLPVSALRTARRRWTSAEESNATSPYVSPLRMTVITLCQYRPPCQKKFRPMQQNETSVHLYLKITETDTTYGQNDFHHPACRAVSAARTHDAGAGNTREVPRCKLHDRDGRIRRRRQIPGKRISSVLLYGRLHLRQALVSRSRHPSLRLFRFSTI